MYDLSTADLNCMRDTKATKGKFKHNIYFIITYKSSENKTKTDKTEYDMKVTDLIK